VPGLTRYRQWPQANGRIAVFTFNVDGWDHRLLAAALSAEYGVALRDGCFCAHPLMLRLLRLPQSRAEELRERIGRGEDVDLPGAVRMSAGLSTTTADVDAAIAALTRLVTGGTRWQYRRVDPGAFVPDPDDRPLPPVGGLA
jgi:selenocysteine lyase/cysteine desulfurase